MKTAKQRVLLVLATMVLAVFASSNLASAAPVTCVDDNNPTQSNKGGQCK